MLLQLCQRYKSESKSQRVRFFLFAPHRCYNYVKDTSLKANHNSASMLIVKILLLQLCQRYKSESKSQHHEKNFRNEKAVTIMSKIQV